MLFITTSIMDFIIVKGWFGDTAKYYYLKGKYFIHNPENIPLAEITIDLDQNFDFIKNNNLHSNRWLSVSGWGRPDEPEEENHLCLHTPFFLNTYFGYFKIIINKGNNRIVIDRAKLIQVKFEEYADPKMRLKYPNKNGIKSIDIDNLDEPPILKHGRIVYQDDYNSVLAKYHQLTAILDSSSFVRAEAKEDKLNKNILNKIHKEKYHSGTNIIEYKTWVNGDFLISLYLMQWEKENTYLNSIFIYHKADMPVNRFKH